MWKEDVFNFKKLIFMFYFYKDEFLDYVCEDIEYGEWLFGRGIMDMKCGFVL